MSNKMLPVGTLLLPNSYQIQRGKPVSGVILEGKHDILGMWYRIHLSNGITKWIGDDVVNDLFDTFCSGEYENTSLIIGELLEGVED